MDCLFIITIFPRNLQDIIPAILHHQQCSSVPHPLEAVLRGTGEERVFFLGATNRAEAETSILRKGFLLVYITVAGYKTM